MASLNKCTFIGNLTRDPEVKYMASGEAVANVSIACNESWKDKSGEKQESVEFVNLVFYRKLAEIAGQYMKKGAAIYVEGKMKTRKWDKDGVTRYSTEIIVNEMQMLGGKSHDAGTNLEAHPKAKTATSQDSSAPAKSNFDNFDDVPF